MIYSNAFVLSLLGLMTAGRMLSTTEESFGSVEAYEKDDHFENQLGNETVRKCRVKDWWVSCEDEADDGSDDDDNQGPRCFIDPVFADD